MPDDTDETPPRPVAPETPAEFKAAAEWYRGRARFHSLMAEQARQMAETFERRAGLARAGTLPRVANRDRLNAMNASPESNARRSAAAVAYPGSKFVQAMTDDGETIAAVATMLLEKLKRPIHRNTIQGWYVPVGEPAHRDIPIDAAEVLRDHYGKRRGTWRVPVDSWPRVRYPNAR